MNLCGLSRSCAPEDSGSSNCTGKVDFDCRATAERAIQDLNGSTLDGAQITVQSLADVPLHFWLLGSNWSDMVGEAKQNENTNRQKETNDSKRETKGDENTVFHAKHMQRMQISGSAVTLAAPCS